MQSKRFATPNYVASYVPQQIAVLQGGMETKDEIRRRRLAQICGAKGGVRQVAKDSGLRWETLDQIIKGVLLPAKQDGTRAARAVGDPVARAIEDAYDLGTGWFDWPLDKVDFRRYWELDSDDRIYVQAKMMSAIEEREKAARPNSEQSAVDQALAATKKMTAGKKKPNGGRKAA